MKCKLKPQANKQITCRIRREMDVDEQLHAIAMTASAMQEDRDGCQAEGMDDYVSKPIRAVEVNLPLKLTHKNGRRRQPIPRREA